MKLILFIHVNGESFRTLFHKYMHREDGSKNVFLPLTVDQSQDLKVDDVVLMVLKWCDVQIVYTDRF